MGVGKIRMEYWFDQLLRQGYQVSLITATEGPEEEGVFRLIPVIKRIGFFLMKDPGFFWFFSLKRFFRKTRLYKDYDVVIVSGNPFMHFGIGKYLKKKKPSLKVFLDYRDPFSDNPRFKQKKVILWIMSILEKQFNRYADKVIIVGESCRRFVKGDDQKVVIVENGFDESKTGVVHIAEKNRLSIIHAGKVYPELSSDIFVNVINTEFHNVIVDNYGPTPFVSDNRHISNHALISYEKLISLMKSYYVGVVFIGGKNFEMPTKIFDYIACKLKVLIITEGELYSAGIYEITKNYPNIYWCYNETKSIKTTLNMALNEPYKECRLNVFSRKESLNKLKKLF
jgi:hypothetical protein